MLYEYFSSQPFYPRPTAREGHWAFLLFVSDVTVMVGELVGLRAVITRQFSPSAVWHLACVGSCIDTRANLN